MFLTQPLTLLLFVSLVSAFEFTADNSFLLNCPINSLHDLNRLEALAHSPDHPIDIFQEKVALDPSEESTVLQLLTDEPTSEILLSQFGCYEEKGRANLKSLFTPDPTPNYSLGPAFHDDYRSYQNIIDQLFFYSREYPQYTKTLKSIGKSVEGRDLFVIHLTDPGNEPGTKPLVWIMAGQHAREWIAVASAMVFIDELLHADQSLLKHYEFAIMPLVNPDGYEYTRTVNRMWRKNRRPTGRKSNGIDLNRNWDHRWSQFGVSKLPNSDIYCGQSAASEPEVSSTQQYILSLPNRFIGFDVHSYSQLILRNYGWTHADSPLEPVTSNLSQLMSDAIFKLYNIRYTPKKSSGLYPVSGSAEDWLYVKAGIPGFVLEMRDKGQHGFKLPPEQIRPTGRELFVGITTAIQNMNK